MEHNTFDWKKYLLVFAITAAIFGTAIYVSNYFGDRKLSEIRTIQDNISIDILSSETQFSLLENSSCQSVGLGSLSTELGTLEDKLSATESDRGVNDPQVIELKKNYSLLEIEDYLLMNKITQECKITPVSIIYFYSNAGDCADCQKEGYVLTDLRQTYPDLRVYSFDYNIGLSAVNTLISINKVGDNLPALVIKGKTYYGFQSLDDIEKAMPELKTLNATSTTVTK